MKIEKNTKISLIYIVLLYLLYNFLFQKFDYTIRYLINFVFLVLIFVKFVFGQLDFYTERCICQLSHRLASRSGTLGGVLPSRETMAPLTASLKSS